MNNLLDAPRTAVRLVEPCVADRLLAEIPRFFNGSVETMLREVFQNAFRAGAQNIHLTVDSSQRTLTIQDDGCGIYDPNLVVTAGATGWGEQVIEPAGLGLFALLTESVAQVIIVSWRERAKPWRLILTQDQLRGLPASVEELTAATPGVSGTLVEIVFKMSVPKKIEPAIQQTRSLFPFTVQTNIDGKTSIVAPYRAWEPESTLEVPGVGVLEWTSDYRTLESEVVWMHQIIPARAFHTALNQAVEKNLAFGIFRKYALRWIIDPSCGVRPKLPDRNDLIEDVHLTQAVQHIAQVFTDHMLRVAEEHTRSLTVLDLDYRLPFAIASKDGDRFAKDEVEKATLVALRSFPTWLRNTDVLKAVLEKLGWVTNVERRYARYAIYQNDESDVVCDEEKRECIYRTLPTVSSAAVAFTLTQMGRPTRWASPTDAGRIQIKKLRSHPQSHHVALCESIQVEGVGEMSYLLSEGGFTRDKDGIEITAQEKRGKAKHAYTKTHLPCIVFAGTAVQFSQWLRKNAGWVLNFIAASQIERDSIWEYDWIRNDELYEDAVLRDVLTEVGAFDQALAQVRQARYDAHDAQVALGEIANQLSHLVYFAKTPHLRHALRGVQQMRRQVRTLSQAVRRVETQKEMKPC